MELSRNQIAQEVFKRPFIPADTGNTTLEQGLGLRKAKALEYIAAQMGMIREILEQRKD